MQKPLKPSAEDTLGPYFPMEFVGMQRIDLTKWRGLRPAPKGDAVELRVAILDENKDPVVPALVECWQADAAGRRRTPNAADRDSMDAWFDGHTRIYAADGRFRLRTIMPGVSGQRAPCVTMNIFCDGISRVATQIFFEGADANESDPLLCSLPEELRSRLIAKKVESEPGEPPAYALDIVMRGDGETPFFEDYDE